MKKFWYSAFVAALVLTGCQKELEENPTVNEGQTISFIAETSADTKSLMAIEGSTVKYSWTDEDTDFHVFYGETETDEPVTSSRSEQALSLTAHFAQGVLPATGNVYFTGYLNGSVKAVQTMDAANGSYDPAADVMIAKASVPAAELSNPILFQFKRVVSVAKLTLSGLSEKTDRVIISSDKQILGSFDQTGNYTAKDGVIEVNGVGDNNIVYFTLAPVVDATLSVTAFASDGVYVGETNGAKTFAAGNVRGTTVNMTKVTQLFRETFDTNNGKGGNDGLWNGTIANNTISSDYNTWTFVKGNGADRCVKFGTKSELGSATTPAITIGSSSAILNFKAAAWDSKDESTILNLSATGGNLGTASVSLEKGEWGVYQVEISNVAGTTTVSFKGEGAESRFFLDDVVVYNLEEYTETRSVLAAPSNISASLDSETPNTINLSWNAVEHADSYEVVLSASEEEDVVLHPSTNSASATGLAYEKEYSIKVKAVSTDTQNYINSDYTNAASTVTTGAKPEDAVEWVATDFDALKAGNQVVIVRTSGDAKALSNNNGTGSAPNAVGVTVSSGKLSGTPDATLIWYVSVDGDYKIFNADKAGSKWLYCTASNNGVRVGTNQAKTFTLSDGYLKHNVTNRYIGVYNDADWRCYTTTANNINNQAFSFFVRVGKAEPTQLEGIQGLNCSAHSASSLTFTWKAVENAEGYKVSVDGGKTYGPTQNETSFVWSDLSADTEYTIYVKAVGDDVNFTDSDASHTSHSTDSAAPVIPGNPVVLTFTSTSDVTSGSYSASVAIGDGSNAPAWNSGELRMYAKNTLTISTTGSNMTKIEIVYHKQGTKEYASASTNVGTYVNGGTSTSVSDSKTDTWTGSAKSVTITLGASGQRVVESINIY